MKSFAQLRRDAHIFSFPTSRTESLAANSLLWRQLPSRSFILISFLVIDNHKTKENIIYFAFALHLHLFVVVVRFAFSFDKFFSHLHDTLSLVMRNYVKHAGWDAKWIFVSRLLRRRKVCHPINIFTLVVDNLTRWVTFTINLRKLCFTIDT